MQASGCALGADISIQKNVPWGAGLGGGSSDAASALVALNRLWGLNWSRAQLAQLALPLGADVPFFVGGQNAFVEGIGERLTPIHLPPAAYAVLKPAAHVATQGIFTHPLLVRDSKPVILLGYLESPQNLLLQDSSWQPSHEEFGKNDLQVVAENSCKEVREAADWLDARFGNSRMTGSGSAVFSKLDMVSNDEPSAAFPATECPVGWVGRMCRSLVEHPLRDWTE